MRRIFWVTALAVLAACGDGLGPDLDLAANRAKWQRQGLAEYSYQFQMYCFCIDVSAVRLFVSDGIVVGGHYVESGEPLPAEIPSWFRRTVDSLFAIIEEAIQRDADHLAVEYHPLLGYPTRIAVDYEERYADDEVTYLATDVTRALPAAPRHPTTPAPPPR